MLLGFKRKLSSNNNIVNFLDVTLNLSDNTNKPFLKTDQYHSYINVNRFEFKVFLLIYWFPYQGKEISLSDYLPFTGGE